MYRCAVLSSSYKIIQLKANVNYVNKLITQIVSLTMNYNSSHYIVYIVNSLTPFEGKLQNQLVNTATFWYQQEILVDFHSADIVDSAVLGSIASVPSSFIPNGLNISMFVC